MTAHKRGFMKIHAYPNDMSVSVRRVIDQLVAGIDNEGTFRSANVLLDTHPLTVKDNLTVSEIHDLEKSGALALLDEGSAVFTVDIVTIDTSFNLIMDVTRYGNVRIVHDGQGRFSLYTAEDHTCNTHPEYVKAYQVLLKSTLDRGLAINGLGLPWQK
jgi:hypothetical protein